MFILFLPQNQERILSIGLDVEYFKINLSDGGSDSVVGAQAKYTAFSSFQDDYDQNNILIKSLK